MRPSLTKNMPQQPSSLKKIYVENSTQPLTKDEWAQRRGFEDFNSLEEFCSSLLTLDNPSLKRLANILLQQKAKKEGNYKELAELLKIELKTRKVALCLANIVPKGVAALLSPTLREIFNSDLYILNYCEGLENLESIGLKE